MLACSPMKKLNHIHRRNSQFKDVSPIKEEITMQDNNEMSMRIVSSPDMKQSQINRALFKQGSLSPSTPPKDTSIKSFSDTAAAAVGVNLLKGSSINMIAAAGQQSTNSKNH